MARDLVVGTLAEFKLPFFVVKLAFDALEDLEARQVLADWMIEHVPPHFDELPWRPFPFPGRNIVGWLLWKEGAGHELLRVERERTPMDDVFTPSFTWDATRALFADGRAHAAAEAWLIGRYPVSPDVFTVRDLVGGRLEVGPPTLESRPVFGIQIERPKPPLPVPARAPYRFG